MGHSLTRRLAAWASASPARLRLVRYGGTLGLVAAVIAIVPRTPLDGPVGGIIALAVILGCAWWGGPGPAALIPVVVLILSRIGRSDARAWTEYSSKEVLTLSIMIVLTTAVGLAGRYRRRIVADSRRHAATLREQARALSLAPIVFRDLDGRIATWNEGAERLYGWPSGFAEGRSLHELLSTRYPRPRAEIEAELLRCGQWRGEVLQRRRDGADLVVAVHGILYSAGDNSARIAEVHTDVTELRRVENALREADRRKDEFLATLAHELRNPLAPIQSGLDVLRAVSGGIDPQEVDGVHQMIQRQIEHLVRLIDDLLDVGRINTGKLELRCEPVPLAEILRDAIEAARPRIEAAGHRLDIAIPDEPITLHADRVRLAQVVLNLLNNATKFTPSGGAISMSAARDAGCAEVRVRDTGVGIEPGMLSRVFDLFSQSDDILTRSHGGLGIGLCISRTLVLMHGGTIEARSAGRNQGSEFVVRLPLRDTAASPGPASLPVGVNGFSARRVLVVDDNQDAARSLATLLGRLGHQCRCAFDGASALESAAAFLPEVVVLDLGMPGMSGLEVARRLRGAPHTRSSLLIALTGWGKDDDRRQTTDAGFDHHLVKPVRLESIRELLAARWAADSMFVSPPAGPNSS